MARWRRLERKSGKLVRCAQVLSSTKGELRSEEMFLAIHPYRRKIANAYEGGTDITIGDSCQFNLDPPETKIETFETSYEITYGTEDWARWIDAGAPDDWNKGTCTKTVSYEVVDVGGWQKEIPDGYEKPFVRTSKDQDGQTILDERDVGVIDLDGYGLYSTTPRKSRNEYDPGEQPGHPVEVEEGGVVIGAYMPPIVEGTGEEVMNPVIRKYVYPFVPYYVGYGGSANAIVKETVSYSAVSFPSGRVQAAQKRERYILAAVGFEIRVWKRPGDENATIEFVGNGHPSASLLSAEGGDEETWEDLPDPEVQAGIDYKPGM